MPLPPTLLKKPTRIARPPPAVESGVIDYAKLRSLETMFDGGDEEPPGDDLLGYGAYCIRAETVAVNKKTGKPSVEITGYSTEMEILQRVERACEMRRASNEICQDPTLYITRFHPQCNPPRVEVRKVPPEN